LQFKDDLIPALIITLWSGLRQWRGGKWRQTQRARRVNAIAPAMAIKHKAAAGAIAYAADARASSPLMDLLCITLTTGR
jgi:hypothetical protein